MSVCPESLIYIQKEEASADTKTGNRQKRKNEYWSLDRGGGGGCEINNRTVIQLDATRCRTERRCWVSYRQCYVLRDAAVGTMEGLKKSAHSVRSGCMSANLTHVEIGLKIINELFAFPLLVPTHLIYLDLRLFGQ